VNPDDFVISAIRLRRINIGVTHIPRHCGVLAHTSFLGIRKPYLKLIAKPSIPKHPQRNWLDHQQ
jgi:hypothetical protein